MRGIIFRLYLDFMKDRFGYETLDKILLQREYPNKGGFSSAGNYKSEYLMKLFGDTAYLFGGSVEKTLEACGRYSFPFLINTLRNSYDSAKVPSYLNDPYDFLENLNAIHFGELHKLHPDAIFPEFIIERKSPTHIVIDYSTRRNIPHLAFGLMKGCFAYFNVEANVTMEDTGSCKLIGDQAMPIYRFEVTHAK